MKKYLSKKNIILIFWPLAIVCLIIAKANADIAENFFCKILNKAYLFIVGSISGIFPFSIAEFIIILLLPFLIFLIVRFIIRLKKANKGEKHLVAIKAFLNFLGLCGIIFFIFVIGCGTNYYRYNFTYYSGYEVEPSPVSDLEEMCLVLAKNASSIRSELTNEDENHAFLSTHSDYELAKLADNAYKKLSEDYDCLKGYYPNPKPVIFSRFMSKCNITGVFFPWTGESNVNVDIPDYSVSSTMCHELAHARGFMREDEANYLAFLACLASDDLELNYSGTLLALIHSGNALYAKDKDRFYKVYEYYSDLVKRDLNENSRYWDQFEDTTISKTAEKINDTYLKINDQEDGVKSYGRMVDLLIANYRATKFTDIYD